MAETIITTADYGTVITDIGSAKMTTATFNKTQINVVSAAVGDGGGAYYYPTPDQIGLISEQWRGDISYARVNATQPNMYDIKFTVPANVGGFTMREAAVYDEDGDIVAICNMPAIPKLSTQEGVSFPFTMMMHIVVKDANALSFTINASLDMVSREEMEKEIQKVSAGVGSAIIKDITIPSGVWTEAADAGKYKFVADVADKDVLDAHFPVMALALPSLDIACSAGLCPTIQTLDGTIRFWSKQKPTADLSGTIQLRSQAIIPVDGSGGFATDEDAKDVVDEIFGTPGTTVPDNSVIASDDEVANEVNGIFG